MNKRLVLPLVATVIIGLSSTGLASLAACPASVDCDKKPAKVKMGPPHMKHLSEEQIEKMKAEHEARKAEFDKRLNLTDAQKKQIEANREADKVKMDPIFANIKVNKEKIKTIIDSDATKAEKDKQIEAIKADIKKEKEKLHEIREANMKSFESILTSKQKAEFEKIKAEQEKEMKERFKNKPPFPAHGKKPMCPFQNAK